MEEQGEGKGCGDFELGCEVFLLGGFGTVFFLQMSLVISFMISLFVERLSFEGLEASDDKKSLGNKNIFELNL